MEHYKKPPTTTIKKECEPNYQSIKSSPTSILAGPNNCGKSYLLTNIKLEMKASFLSTNRDRNFELMDYSDANRLENYNRNFPEYAKKQPLLIDQMGTTAASYIADLSDSQRKTLVELMKEFLQADVEIMNVVPGNSMSQSYLTINGNNITFASTGSRLIAMLFACLLNTDFKTFMIDEPELGLSPVNQRLVATFIFDREKRAKYLPHIEHLIIATHSGAFLDRQDPRNNYFIIKLGSEITIEQAKTPSDLHRINFFLLGNRFEDWCLPSLIVMVEGPSDETFISAALRVAFPDRRISVMAARSNSDLPNTLNVMKKMLTDIQDTPYHNRVIVVTDAVHDKQLKGLLADKGFRTEDMVVWSENGIEYYYPEEILDAIFGPGGTMQISANEVSRNDKRLSKVELSAQVSQRLMRDTKHRPEFDKFIEVMKKKLA